MYCAPPTFSIVHFRRSYPLCRDISPANRPTPAINSRSWPPWRRHRRKDKLAWLLDCAAEAAPCVDAGTRDKLRRRSSCTCRSRPVAALASACQSRGRRRRRPRSPLTSLSLLPLLLPHRPCSLPSTTRRRHRSGATPPTPLRRSHARRRAELRSPSLHPLSLLLRVDRSTTAATVEAAAGAAVFSFPPSLFHSLSLPSLSFWARLG